MDRLSAPFMRPDDASAFLSPLSSRDGWEAWGNQASALYVLGRTAEAEASARQAVRLRRNPATLLNLAVILETQSRFEEAMPLAAEAFAADPSSPLAACLHSDALLRAGHFAAAWPLYASSHTNVDWLRAVLPEWDGMASLAGRRLLVVSAGGFGDTILFSRWLPNLRHAGAIMTLMTPRSLASLLAPLADATVAGNAGGVDGDLPLADYDLFTCILSLGGYFCPSPRDVPTDPYLSADSPHDPGPAIGICTRAGEESFPRRHRSLNSDQTLSLLRAFDRAGIRAANLNYNAPLPGTLHPPLRDWSDTAAVIASLSLVITVDTGVAHLAGALGIPCWVMLPGISAAYYGLAARSADHSPFYPSQRLFRNSREGIGESVSAVANAIAEWRPCVQHAAAIR